MLFSHSVNVVHPLTDSSASAVSVISIPLWSFHSFNTLSRALTQFSNYIHKMSESLCKIKHHKTVLNVLKIKQWFQLIKEASQNDNTTEHSLNIISENGKQVFRTCSCRKEMFFIYNIFQKNVKNLSNSLNSSIYSKHLR